ncbi:MAG TPA: hypothetical protein PLZ69_02840 [Candidatus Pacearchaeota archaeon]|nr:hypothetical protein [Candidatus Pacearchaeota archaeon]
MQTKIINSPDMFLEVKGIIALIFDAVMRLEDAYKSGNQQERHLRLKQFRQYRQFFNGQVENGNFTLSQKIDLYNKLMNCCIQILSHDREFYQIYPVIKRRTQHYVVRISERIDQLVEQLTEVKELEEAIKIKEDAINNLKKMRHHYQLIVDGVTYSVISMTAQLNEMLAKLDKISKGGK